MSSLGKGLAEIDGILAGCEYLDLYDQYSPARRHVSPASDYDHASIPAYQRQETPDLGAFFRSRCSPSSSAKPTHPVFASSPRPGSLTPGGESKPSAAQWEALQTLRDGVDLLFTQFKDLSSSKGMHSDVVDRLQECYGDARGMRESGLLTYKDILQGISPGELRLEEIFAFSCLSYSLAKFLDAKGNLREGTVLRGLPVWREAVADGDRSAFDFLARSLWPEAGQILDAADGGDMVVDVLPDICSLPQDPQFLAGSDPLCMPSGLPVADNMFAATAGLGLTPNGLACDPSWLMPLPTLSDQALDLMLDSNSVFAFEDLQAGGPAGAFSAPPSYTDSICPSLADSPSSSQSPPPIDFTMDTQTPPPLIERMKNTDMFRVFALWFSHVYGLSEFLWTLSGEGAFSQKTGKRSGFAAARQSKQFQSVMLEQFFAPLAENLPAAMVDILRLTKSRLLEGVLSSLRDVERHIFSISKAFDLHEDTRKWFLETVLNRCLKVSRNMKSCVYATSDREVYSEQYVKSKLDSCFGGPSPAASPSPSRSPTAVKRSSSQDTEDSIPEVARPPKKSSRVACPICGKSYSGHSNLSRHKKQEHRQGSPLTFPCKVPGCKKVCSRADNLKQHVELVHKKHEGEVVA